MLSYSVLYLIVIIVLFILLRGVNLWYWKINNIVDEQVKQTEILEKILKNIDKKSIDEKSESTISLDTKEDFTFDKNEYENLKSDLKKDEVIVRIKRTNQLQKINNKDWEEIIKIGNSDKFDLIDD